MSIPGPGGRCGILAIALTSMVAIGFRASRVESPSSPLPIEAAPTRDAATRLAGEDEAWWQTVSTGLQRQEYEATPGESGLQAPNRAQNLRTHFGPRGIEIEPRVIADATPAWRFGWQTTGLGRPGQMTEAGPAIIEHDGARVTYVRPGWSEWYENTADGLEQGFTVHDRPAGEGPLTIAGIISGGLRPELREDGDVEFLDAQGACPLRYGKLQVWDANGRRVDSRLAIEGTELAIRVEDTAADYPLSVDPLMTSPAWTAESNQADAFFGFSVATAGDVNGDGFSDVIVGAPGYDNGETDEGRAFAYHGSATGLNLTPAWTAESNQADAEFGLSVATAGDVNGDGFCDVIVGARFYDNGQTDEGRAFAYHGSAAGLATTPAWTAESNQTGALLGSVATAGDVNGDGFSDVILGAIYYSNGEDFEGRAFAYHGSAAGLSLTPAWIAESNYANAFFGFSVATAGDVNGDGFSDVIVGADQYENGEFTEGRAFVYHGSAAGLAISPSWTAEPNHNGAHFGISVATAGDVNGDGFSDVIIGAHLFSNGENEEGGAFVYNGSAVGLATTPAWTVESNQAFAFFGKSVATAGDVNGDGFSDVIVGAYPFDNGESYEGRAFVYNGSAAGLPTSPSWTAESNQVGAEFGYSVATAGDVNGDGFSDVILGAIGYDNGQTNEGRAFVYHGGAEGLAAAPAWFTNGGQTNAGWGYSVATAGDVNGDGYSDIIAVADRFDNGQADEGKAWAYYGSPAGVPLVPAWSAETNQLAAELSSAASAGDVNGDGYSDVILGSYHYDNGEGNEGRTFLYLGSPAGLGGAPAWTSESNQAGAEFGWSVGSAGDVNGDGYADVIVGADGWDNGENFEGRAWLYLGSAGGLGAPAWSVEGNQDVALLGYSVGTAGDVNGDGFSDVLISLPNYDHGEQDEGVVWVFHGSAQGLGASPSRVLEANQASALFGFDVATAGDVNGDGYSDVIVGAQSYDNGQTDEGRAFVYHGGASGLTASPVWTTEPDQGSAQYGRSVATVGDVNGDGYSDVMVGAPYCDIGAVNDGAIWVYHGSPTGLLGAPAWFSYGGQSNAFFGLALGTAGDVNGDGFSDVIASAFGYDYSFTDEGAVWVFLGNGGDGLHRLRGQMRTDHTRPIDLLGLSNSESAVTLNALARTPAGRGKVRLEIEMKPMGMPFNGTGLVTSPFTLTSTPGFDGSIASFVWDVGGLLSGTVYHWRLRFASNSPFFPQSPWLWLPYNGANEGDVRTAGNPTDVAEDSAPPAAGPWLGRATPNPFVTSTEIGYTLPQHAMVSLGVFDVQGRQVAKLAEGAQPEGQHQVRWSGKDTGGNQLAAGVYFVRLEFAGHIEAQKIVLSR